MRIFKHTTADISEKAKAHTLDRGFTFIEIIVVISLFAIMAGLVLFKYRDYQSNLLLENTAQDIALEIQKAENNSVSGVYPPLSIGQTLPSGWRPSYGVFFDPTTLPKKFVFFYDSESLQPSDPAYQAPGTSATGSGWLDDTDPVSQCGNTGSECLNVVSITGDVSIDSIWQGGLSDYTPGISLGDVSVSFIRPFPDRYAAYGALGQTASPTKLDDDKDMRIRLKSDTTGNARDIVVSPLGEIHIETVQ
jgi:prepilin-type N-terminal cleavage/methylation domain-containing protein